MATKYLVISQIIVMAFNEPSLLMNLVYLEI